eukprot:361944-Chlamydomonas_euryale.AAC.9
MQQGAIASCSVASPQACLSKSHSAVAAQVPGHGINMVRPLVIGQPVMPDQKSGGGIAGAAQKGVIRAGLCGLDVERGAATGAELQACRSPSEPSS